MPREGIDYPGWFNRAACSIRCELSKLWSAVGTKLSKINTVEPDGDGKVKIVSDSATLTVTDDPSNNAVRLELDAGLSSPPVDSVNGKTGTVVLNSTDISGYCSVYNGTTINAELSTVYGLFAKNAIGAKAGDDALRTRMTAAETAISTETNTRIAEDALLQSALNGKADTGDSYTKQESDARYADVATPHTWAELQTFDDGIDVNGDADVSGDLDVGGDLDVTGTTALSSLTVSGNATIGGTLGVTGDVTADSIDANLTGDALTDASAAAQIVVNADTSLVRTTGNQTIAGTKTFDVNPVNTIDYVINNASNGWYKIYEYTGYANFFTDIYLNQGDCFLIRIGWRTQNMRSFFLSPRGSGAAALVRITKDSSGKVVLWVNVGQVNIHHMAGYNNSGNSVKPSIPADYNTPYPEPTTSDYTTVITPAYQA